MVGRGLDQVTRVVPVLVHRLAERLGAVRRGCPLREDEAPTDDALAFEEIDEIVEPVDEQRLEAVGLSGELVVVPLLDGVPPADELEEREACRREQLGTVPSADDEADVGLVLEGLPAQE